MDNNGNNSKINDNIFSSHYKFSAVNPFNGSLTPPETTSANPFEQKPQEPAASNPIKRLNGYDSAILNNTRFDEPDGEDLSLEYRIKDKESTLRDLNAKIKTADNYGTLNEALSLKAKRQRIMQELDTLRKQQLYGGRVLGERKQFSHNDFKERMPVIYKIQEFISRQIMARLSKKVKSVVTLSDSLDKLSEISKSVDELIDMKSIGIRLTENGMMQPHASVCGLMLAHPQARYFAVGKIDEHQLADYAARRGKDVSYIRNYLTTNLQY